MNVAELADSLLKIPGLRKMMQLLTSPLVTYFMGRGAGLDLRVAWDSGVRAVSG